MRSLIQYCMISLLTLVLFAGCAKVQKSSTERVVWNLTEYTPPPALAKVMTSSSDASQKIIELSFSGATNYIYATTATYPHPSTIIMTFPGGAVSNTFTCSLIRGAVTNRIVSYTGTMQTFLIYLPAELLFKTADIVRLENTALNQAVATLNTVYPR